MAETIKHRLVLYCPGYDAAAGTRYRRLFVAEFARLAEQFAVEREIGPVETDAAVPSIRWTVAAGTREWHTETIYEVLRWDDLIRDDLNRTWRKRGPLLLAGVFAALREGVISRLFRIDWHFAVALFCPLAMLLGVVLASFGIAYGAARVIHLVLPHPAIVTGIITVAFAAALLRAAQPALRRAYVYHVTDDWIFNWQCALGERPDFDARLERFGQRIAAAVRENTVEEILIVGHSTGARLAIEATARALTLAPGLTRHGPSLALLTIGSRLPVAALWSSAGRIREAITRLASEPSLLWVDYQAPQDVFNAFRFDPVRDLRLDLGTSGRANPVIRSPRFKNLLLPRTYRRIRWNFFRVHFQFLMLADRPGEYDYLMMACGPVSLAERIRDPEAAVKLIYDTSIAAPTDRVAAA